jgi:hypothetical protein
MLKKHLLGQDKSLLALSRCGKMARLRIACFKRLQQNYKISSRESAFILSV